VYRNLIKVKLLWYAQQCLYHGFVFPLFVDFLSCSSNHLAIFVFGARICIGIEASNHSSDLYVLYFYSRSIAH